jgi:F-type H+-transporting ATPase subunit b
MHVLAAAATQQDPLIPSLPELIVGTICFVLVFGFLGKMFLPRNQPDRGRPEQGR